MIINQLGKQFTFEGITYTIGDKILANKLSSHEGLYGVITGIHTDTDTKVGGGEPDIYCDFYPPFDPEGISQLESYFSKRYKQEMKLNDITLKDIVLCPEGVIIVTPYSATRMITAYRVEENWVIRGEPGQNSTLALDESQAKLHIAELVHTESVEGCISEWRNDPRFEVECSSTCYECWIRDEYCENRYKVSIIPEQISVDNLQYQSFGRSYVDCIMRKHFALQIECWEELEGMTDAEIDEMVAGSDVPRRIKKQLENNRFLIEAYWESVSEAAFDIVKRYRASLGLSAEPND